jgi:hypothetical protein
MSRASITVFQGFQFLCVVHMPALYAARTARKIAAVSWIVRAFIGDRLEEAWSEPSGSGRAGQLAIGRLFRRQRQWKVAEDIECTGASAPFSGRLAWISLAHWIGQESHGTEIWHEWPAGSGQ